MPRQPKPKKEAEFLAPFLPLMDTLPDRHEIIEHVVKYKHNAKTTMKDEDLCFRIIDARLRGHGKKRIAKECGVSKHTVQAVWDECERRGILAPYKQRISKKAGEIIEDGLDELHERILDGSIADNILPVVVGVVADKKAAWDGQPGLIVEHRGPIIDVETANGFWERISSPENQSGELAPIPQQLPAPSGAWAQSGAQLPPASGPIVDVDLVPTPTPAAASPDPEARAAGGGGGREIPTGAANLDVSPSGAKFAKGSSDTGAPSPATPKFSPEEKPPAS